jgi:small subunit ribosomal protein S14
MKERRRRCLVATWESRRRALLARVHAQFLPIRIRTRAYISLQALPRDSSITRRHNRCTLTGRGRAVYRSFGLSRLAFRRLAWSGELVGVRKSSW